MAFESVLGDLKKSDDVDAVQILNSLLNPKNIDMKTHIISPIAFAIFEAILKDIENLLTEIGKDKKLKLPRTVKLLKNLDNQIKMFMVSWNRQSRNEITSTLQSIREEGATDRSFFQKLTGTGRT